MSKKKEKVRDINEYSHFHYLRFLPKLKLIGIVGLRKKRSDTLGEGWKRRHEYSILKRLRETIHCPKNYICY